ncbi:probable 18S rRNA (guanine-N(7))-methyltransferase [Zophobas morio]|uniref:probable 18S rRNA (guanine-N(7))-methyltransferase n=1 Tax=Zophobas morio TaxID=2755281 RepID=UPI003082AC71
MSRPEHTAPPELYYNEREASKYQQNSRMREIQTVLTRRALELLCLPDRKSCFLLDIGCGTGISGEEISAQGHYWTGIDISPHMLNVALEQGVEGDLFWRDMGQGLNFRAGTFDGALSISALQWLCNADRKSHNPIKRLNCFFQSLYKVLSRGSRAVLQFYPETAEQMNLIIQSALRAGFGGGTVVDYPNSSKAKKIYLVLICGPETVLLPHVEGLMDSSVSYLASKKAKRTAKGQRITLKEFIRRKKERQRKQGRIAVRPDSKYSGRKRRVKW